MKKVLLPLTGVVLMLANAGAEAGTQLDFNATVVQTCKLSMSSNPMQVGMGIYPTSYFSKALTGTPFKYFTINVSGCPNSKVALRWRGNIANGNEYLLAVNGGADGLGIVLSNENVHRRSGFVSTPGDDMFILPKDGSLDFNMAAFYESYKDIVSPGPANASATVEVVYQ